MNAIASIPGLREGSFHGLPALIIETPQCTAAISLFGAHVLSFVPAGHTELLWLSPTTRTPPLPIRGGVPLCWPYFAKQGQRETAHQHGTARIEQWVLSRARSLSDGAIELVLSPVDDAKRSIRVALTVRFGATLAQTLVTSNHSEEPFTLTQAFHSYFRVADATKISIEGLKGHRYLDKFQNFAEGTQVGAFTLDTQCDRVYQRLSGPYSLIDPTLQRRITLRSEGSRTLVVWNPGAEVVKTFVDIPHDAWRDYFCLEVANAGEEVAVLAPGASTQLTQIVGSEAIA
jgi:glucose-6-phosphate 1-epimerase